MTPQGPVPNTPMLGRRPVLDGIRGIAIILVLARHSAPNQFGGAGFAGVDLFFVLSGFLITTLLIEERDRTGQINLGQFFLRRALRLLPALYVMLAVAVLFTLFAPIDGIRDNLTWYIAAATYTTPIVEWVTGTEGVPGVGVVWSLATEEYFYLVWPVLFIAISALRSRHVTRTSAIIALIVISITARIWTWFAFGSAIYPMPWTWTDALLIGCLTASIWKAGNLPSIPAVVQWAALGFIGAFCLLPNAKELTFTYTIGITLLAVAGAVSILAALDERPRFITTTLDRPWLRWFGTRSYGLYLWNAIFLVTEKPYPIPRALDIVAGLILSVVAAELSYRFVEQPALRFKKRFEPRARRKVEGVAGSPDGPATPSRPSA